LGQFLPNSDVVGHTSVRNCLKNKGLQLYDLGTKSAPINMRVCVSLGRLRTSKECATEAGKGKPMKERYLSKEAMLTMNLVSADFFLRRVREFEKRYNMSWQEFVAKYSKGALPGGCEGNSDFAEWNFLCSKFTAELLKTSDISPPARENFEGQEPEAISGFLIFRREFVRPSPIWQPCERHSLESEGRYLLPTEHRLHHLPGARSLGNNSLEGGSPL
jgi:hypothetical protein